MNDFKKDIADLKAVADQLLLQVSMNSAKINTLHHMVLGVYRDTLDENTWKNIHRNYFNALNDTMQEAFQQLDDVAFESTSFVKHQLNFQMMIKQTLENLDK